MICWYQPYEEVAPVARRASGSQLSVSACLTERVACPRCVRPHHPPASAAGRLRVSRPYTGHLTTGLPVWYAGRVSKEVIIDIPFQRDMFTGDLVDTRTATQRRGAVLQQLPMFSINETFTFGTRARPYLAAAPKPKLELVCEDVRTPEEIEADLEREARALTASLFGDETPPASPSAPVLLIEPDALQPVIEAPDSPEDAEDDEDDIPELPPLAPPLTPYAAYCQLIAAAEEQAGTLDGSPALRVAQRISLSAAQFAAKQAGLNETEIATAITIGEFRGRTPATTPPEPAKETVLPAADEPPEPAGNDREIPIRWLYRSDLVKRRPDLAQQIGELREHEIEALAALVGEALEEFYWIQLNVVLSLYLDHDLALRRIPKKKVTAQAK